MALPPQRGFTLLELLVVLAIVALASATAVPRVVGWLEGAERRAWRADLRAQLERYPVQAFLTGEALEVDAERLRRDLGGRWPSTASIELQQPLRYAANGVASGARIELKLDAWSSQWQIAPLTGEVRDLSP